jgi:hypothetical protein
MSGRFSEGTRHQLAHAGAHGLLSADGYSKLAAYPAYADLALAWARVRHNSNQAIGSGAYATLAFDTEVADASAYHDAGSNTRLTCPSGNAGPHLILFHGIFAANAAGARYARLLLNGATALAEDGESSVGADAQPVSVATIYSLAAGDYVEAQVYQNSGGSLNLTSAGAYTPVFMLARLRIGDL